MLQWSLRKACEAAWNVDVQEEGGRVPGQGDSAGESWGWGGSWSDPERPRAAWAQAKCKGHAAYLELSPFPLFNSRSKIPLLPCLEPAFSAPERDRTLHLPHESSQPAQQAAPGIWPNLPETSEPQGWASGSLECSLSMFGARLVCSSATHRPSGFTHSTPQIAAACLLRLWSGC